MPTYSYIAEDPEKGCPSCRRGFDLRRPMDRAPLEVCPLCKKPVKKLIAGFNTPKYTKPLSVSDAKRPDSRFWRNGAMVATRSSK